MFGKLAEATRLLLSNIVLFSLIVLTIWLPGNLLIEYLAFNVFGEEETLAVATLNWGIVSIFGPLYIGALVYAASRRKEGHEVTYSEAMGVGFRNWGRLFVARLVAGLLIALGCLALVIPGLILLVRYALLDAVVILEGANSGQARRRSVQLTTGIRWRVFETGLIFIVGWILLMFIITMPLAAVEQLDTMIGNVIVDCVIDVASTVISIALFLFYWEARERERGEAAPASLPA